MNQGSHEGLLDFAVLRFGRRSPDLDTDLLLRFGLFTSRSGLEAFRGCATWAVFFGMTHLSIYLKQHEIDDSEFF